MEEYTVAQVAEHNSAQDCWVILNGDVLDLTNFAAVHPGKGAHLYGAGRDIGELMQKIHGQQGHPAGAYEWAKSFKIGTIKSE